MIKFAIFLLITNMRKMKNSLIEVFTGFIHEIAVFKRFERARSISVTNTQLAELC